MVARMSLQALPGVKEPPRTHTHTHTALAGHCYQILIKIKVVFEEQRRAQVPPTLTLSHTHTLSDPIQSPSPFLRANLRTVQISNTSIPLTLIRFCLANCASLPLLLSLLTPPSPLLLLSLALSLHLSTPFMFGNGRTLFGNKIKSVAKKAFSGLETLEHL